MCEKIEDGAVTLGEELFLEYRNAYGETSSRRIKILKSRGAIFNAIDIEQSKYLTFRKDRIIKLENGAGNKIEFAYVPFTTDRTRIKQSEPRPNYNGTICFTGFPASIKAELGEKAENIEFLVRKSVTKDLEYLCCGPNAGPKKIEKAQAAGIWLISLDEFYDLIDDGVIPDRD